MYAQLKKIYVAIDKNMCLYSFIKGIQEKNRFKSQFTRFRHLSEKYPQRFILNWKERYPCLDDDMPYTDFDRHYIYHPSWAARVLAKIRPETHVDISSTLHFCAIISAFIPVKFYDYRPPNLQLSNLILDKTDLTSLQFKDNSIDSLSCMHVVEHIGLGRYGDPLDPEGDIKAINELKRVVSPKGNLLFVVPIGEPKILFNAHRIYSYDQIIKYFSDFQLVEFLFIPDDPEYCKINNVILNQIPPKLLNGCGCFWFKKS